MSTALVPPPLSGDNATELEAVCRMIQRAGGCVLSFCWVNHPGLRERLVEEAKSRLAGFDIAEITVNCETGEGIVEQWERLLATRKPAALFVYGIERVFDYAAGYTHAIAVLNLNRGYIAQRFPYPIVFWGPDFAMVEFSRQAPDTWSARSGSFHFTGGPAETAETIRRLDEADFWSSSGRDKLERKLLLERVCRELESEPSPDAKALAEARLRLAGVLSFEGQQEEAERLYGEALSVYQQIGDRLGEANVQKARGDVARMQDRYEEAERLYGEALPLYRQVGDGRGQANAQQARGDVALMQARYEEAERLYGEALPLYRQIGDRLGQASVQKARGDVALVQDRYEEAERLYGQALPLYRQIGSRLGEANVQKGRGDVARMQDRYEEAEQLYGEALLLYRQIGSRLGEAGALFSMGRLARATPGKDEEARWRFTEAARIYTAIGDTEWARRAAEAAASGLKPTQ